MTHILIKSSVSFFFSLSLNLKGNTQHDYRRNSNVYWTPKRKTKQHYHKEIHHCYICDYKILLASPNEKINQSIDFKTINSEIVSFYKSAFIANHSFSFSLRAPPFVF